MAIRGVRYAGNGAEANRYNAGTSPGAAIVLTGCRIEANVPTAGRSRITRAGHGYAFAAGDALYVRRGTDALTEAIYEIVAATADTIDIAGLPGNTATHDATVRINGLWTPAAAGSNAAGEGPNLGDEVRVYLTTEETAPGGWLLQRSGARSRPIRYRACDASFTPLSSGYAVVASTNAGAASIDVSGAHLQIEGFHGKRTSLGFSRGIRVQSSAANVLVRRCRATGAMRGVELAGAEAYLVDSEVSECPTGVWARHGNVVFGNYVHDCPSSGIETYSGGVVLGNRIRDCGAGIALSAGDPDMGNAAHVILHNAVHGVRVGVKFNDVDYGQSAWAANNIFDAVSGWAIDDEEIGQARHALWAMNNGYHGCGGGAVNASRFGGLLNDHEVTLAAGPFVDPDDGDFSLAAGCAAIGAGTPEYADLGALTRRPRAGLPVMME